MEASNAGRCRAALERAASAVGQLASTAVARRFYVVWGGTQRFAAGTHRVSEEEPGNRGTPLLGFFFLTAGLRLARRKSSPTGRDGVLTLKVIMKPARLRFI